MGFRKTVLLDLDGTLIDSSTRHQEVFRSIITGDKLSECKFLRGKGSAEYLAFKRDGRSTGEYCRKILRMREDEIQLIQKSWKTEIEKEQYLQMDILYEDTLEFLKQMDQLAIRIVFLTARQNKDALCHELNRLKLTVWGAEAVVVNPQRAVEEKKQVATNYANRGQTCIIGDTEVEYGVAEKLKIPAFLLNRGFRSKRFWERRGIVSYEGLNAILEEKWFEKDIDNCGGDCNCMAYSQDY